MGTAVYTNDDRFQSKHPIPNIDGRRYNPLLLMGVEDRNNLTSKFVKNKLLRQAKSESPDWILNIHGAKVEDTGTYECQINTEPKKSKSYVLSVVGNNRKCTGSGKYALLTLIINTHSLDQVEFIWNLHLIF